MTPKGELGANARHPYFFVSYCVDDGKFVRDTCNILTKYFGPENFFLFEEHPSPEEGFLKRMKAEVKRADGIIFFVGHRFDTYQSIELADAVGAETSKAVWHVGIAGQNSEKDFPAMIRTHAGARPILFDHYTDAVPPRFVRCARELLDTINAWCADRFPHSRQQWDDARLLHGLPKVPQLFDYEKTIIDFYSALQRNQQRAAGESDERWPDERIRALLENGVPAQWPTVYRYSAPRDNYLDPTVAGDFREGSGTGEPLVRAAALMSLAPSDADTTFFEAGPRRKLALPHDANAHQLKVAILVAGGIAPGINAVIDALVQRHFAYCLADAKNGRGYDLQIFGIKNGFLAIENHLDPTTDLIRLTPADTVEFATRAGSMLGTSRDDELKDLETRRPRLQEIASALTGFDVLYVICGDGGMKAAHALWHFANLHRPADRPLSVVTVPKTMDNDILWVWQSFGFLSAVDESRKIVETLHEEVRSNPRIGIVQLFGSDSGFVVSHAVLASAAGHATLALIPEMRFSVLAVARYLKRRLWQATRGVNGGARGPIDQIPHCLVVMAENAMPVDALECIGLAPAPPGLEHQYQELQAALKHSQSEFLLTEREKRIIVRCVERMKAGVPFEGQTDDVVRRLGLRVLADSLPFLLRQNGLLPAAAAPWPEPDWSKLRVVCSEPRHLVRALGPSTSDIINGQRLGLLAVDAAMAGYTDCMISQWLTEFTIVPLDLVVLGRKRIPPQGMFWKSVTSKTGQDSDLVSPYPLQTPHA